VGRYVERIPTRRVEPLLKTPENQPAGGNCNLQSELNSISHDEFSGVSLSLPLGEPLIPTCSSTARENILGPIVPIAIVRSK
jgi:hypothetical protein